VWVGAFGQREDLLRLLSGSRSVECEKGQEGEGDAASREHDGIPLIGRETMLRIYVTIALAPGSRVRVASILGHLPCGECGYDAHRICSVARSVITAKPD
jgi:hypothetical protein